MKEIQLSLIIPIFNVEKYLKYCLRSVLEQETDDIEIIMVEDCSTDESLTIAKQFDNEFKNSTLILHKENKGLGPARNTALSIAQGIYIMMLDSDDWITSESISTILKEIKLNPCDIFQFGCHKVHPNKYENNLYVNFPSKQITTIEKKQLLLSLPNYVWLKIIRRDFILEHNIEFENIFYEDIPWSIQLTILASSIKLVPICIYNYRQRVGSIIYTQSSKHLDLLKAYEHVYYGLSNSNINLKFKSSINNSFISAAYYLHLQRKQRLGGHYLNDFAKLYFNIVMKNRVMPTTFRALAMLVITTSKLIFRRSREKHFEINKSEE